MTQMSGSGAGFIGAVVQAFAWTYRLLIYCVLFSAAMLFVAVLLLVAQCWIGAVIALGLALLPWAILISFYLLSEGWNWLYWTYREKREKTA